MSELDHVEGASTAIRRASDEEMALDDHRRLTGLPSVGAGAFDEMDVERSHRSDVVGDREILAIECRRRELMAIRGPLPLLSPGAIEAIRSDQ